MKSEDENKKNLEQLKLVYEVEVEKQNIRLKKLECITNEDKSIIDKISQLKDVLSTHVIDQDKTILGSEPIFKTLLDSDYQKEATSKLMELIRKL